MSALLIGEFLAQPLAQLADERKAFAKYSNISFAGAGGAWIRDGDTILNVQGRSSVAQFGGMLIFDLAARQSAGRHRPRRTCHRRRVRSPGNCRTMPESRFTDDSVTSLQSSQRLLHTAAGADLLQLAVSRSGRAGAAHAVYGAFATCAATTWMPSSTYLRSGRAWRAPLGILAALLFALPFGFGALRSTSLSARTTLGSGAGHGLFLSAATG